jgi:hypothetical protein
LQRQALLEAERKANSDQPRNFREDALTDKVVSVEPDGTGPTSTASFDAEQDKARNSGSANRSHANTTADAGGAVDNDATHQNEPPSESVAGEEDPGAALDEPAAQAGVRPHIEKHDPASSKRS